MAISNLRLGREALFVSPLAPVQRGYQAMRGSAAGLQGWLDAKAGRVVKGVQVLERLDAFLAERATAPATGVALPWRIPST